MHDSLTCVELASAFCCPYSGLLSLRRHGTQAEPAVKPPHSFTAILNMAAVRPLSLPPATEGRAKSGGRGLDLRPKACPVPDTAEAVLRRHRGVQAEQKYSRGPMVIQIENF